MKPIKPINVLSLFDGISVGYSALKELNIQVNNYYAAETDSYCGKISRKNHSDIIELGDVRDWREWNLNDIDLLLAAPPCQSWSVAGNGKGLDDPRGQLVITVKEILETIKCKWFLIENVRMRKDKLKFLDRLWNVEHVMINTKLVSAQNRVRCYWCNWNVPQPEPTGIMLKDILEDDAICTLKKYHGQWMKVTNKSLCLDSNYWKGVDNHGQRTMVKTADTIRKFTPRECERLQGLEDNYTESVSNTRRWKMIGNAWNLPTIVHILKQNGELYND